MATLDEKNTYYIDYGTGAGNFEFTGTLEEAMEEANKGLCYTQVPVSISIKMDAMILLISLGMELKHQKMT